MARWGWVWASFALGCAAQGGSDDDAAETMVGSSDEGVASSDSSSGDACGAGCQPGGTVLWETTWAGSPGGSDAVRNLDIGASGRIAMTGYANWLGGEYPSDGFVAVYDPDGTVVVAAENPHISYGVAVDGDDSVVVGGNDDFWVQWLRRYDSSGAQAWDFIDPTARYGGGGPIEILADGDIAMGGGTELAGLVTRYGADASPIAFVETPTNVYVAWLAQLDGDIIALGDDLSGSYWIGRMTAAGAFTWSSTHLAMPKALAVAPDGTILVTVSNAGGISELHRFAADGELLTTTTLPKASSVIEDLLPLDDGGYAIAGYVIDVRYHAWVARLSENFAIEWELSYAGEPAPSEFLAIELADDGSFVVAGSKGLTDGSTDAWVLRVAP